MVFTSLVHLVDQLSVYTISLSHTKVFDKWNLQGKCNSWTDLFLEAGYGEEQYYIFHLLPCCLPMRAPFHFSECAHSMKKPTRNQDWYCHKYFFLSKNKVNRTKYQPARRMQQFHITSSSFYLFLCDLCFICLSHKLVM